MKNTLLAFFISLLFALPAMAANVTAVKGSKVMVDLQGAEVQPGDEFFLINPATGKKSAIVRVKQVKNGRAVADVVQGRGSVGAGLQAKASSAKSAKAAKTASPTAAHEEALAKASSPDEEAAAFDRARDMSFLRTLRNSYGLLGQYAMNSMTPTITDPINPTEKPALKGSGLGAGGFYEWVLTRNITVRTSGMLEQFNVSGKTERNVGCNSTTNCSANITYLSGYALAKYYITTNQIRTWAGVGGGFLIAMSKSATALDENQIATNQVLNLAIGGDYQLNRKNYVPFSVEYIYFPPSDTVTASSILFKVGYAWQ
ncbi:hypothetical protein ACLVWU_07340 [Bdellovibrio sp. HCB290]|uniref:hypothetical protein n=1 Tax=Bdellovibrio sp. HCB290 TaxID=3394356 RepID=UPI0039B418ED